MALPEPCPGLVLSYAYLWHREHRSGRDEGIKDSPCVVVLAVRRPDGINTMVRVAPTTHSPPDDPATALTGNAIARVRPCSAYNRDPIKPSRRAQPARYLPPSSIRTIVLCKIDATKLLSKIRRQ